MAASYLLCLLVGNEPRGLPGTIPYRIELQRGSDGRFLDDVVVRARSVSGAEAVLEIQVKRTVSFAPADRVFKSVVAQIAKASQRPEFFESPYEVAVAIERSSTKVEQHYKQVLAWAKAHDTADSFRSFVDHPGVASNDMRKFVETVGVNLGLAGVANDAVSVWRILRRFQILTFDFSDQGSAEARLARDRASLVLAPPDVARASDLWNALIHEALATAACGGAFGAADLRATLSVKHGYRWSEDRGLSRARAALEEATASVLNDIGSSAGGVEIERTAQLNQVRGALEVGRYVEVRGAAGVGKSALLKQLARQLSSEGGIVALSPDRTLPGGWLALAAAIGCNATAKEFFADLAGCGHAFLFIDGLDSFDDGRRATALDLLRTAVEVPEFSVVISARLEFDFDEPSWVPADLLDRLGRGGVVVVRELDDGEVAKLVSEAPSLSPLLANTHPAHSLGRNLFRLARLAATGSNRSLPATEAAMAIAWWRCADGGPTGRRERSRLLRHLALSALQSGGPYDVSNHEPGTVDALVRGLSLRESASDLVAFQHDVLREWAIGCFLFDDPSVLNLLPKGYLATPAVTRGVEITARLLIEKKGGASAWAAFVQNLSGPNFHGSLRRAALLALTRSERAVNALDVARDVLLKNNGVLFAELARVALAVEGVGWNPILNRHRAQFDSLDFDRLPTTLHSWFTLIDWSLNPQIEMPDQSIPALIQLYFEWYRVTGERDPLTPRMPERLFAWLIRYEQSRSVDDDDRALVTRIRHHFLRTCNHHPESAHRYLNTLGLHRGDTSFEVLLRPGRAGRAAPGAYLDLARRMLLPQRDSETMDRKLFKQCNWAYYPPSPAKGPFLFLLHYSLQSGLELIRQTVAHALRYEKHREPFDAKGISVRFPTTVRTFGSAASYEWSRGRGGPDVAASALMALEAWGHKSINDGTRAEEVLDAVLGGDSTPAAFLLVAVDLILSHWPGTATVAWPFVSNPILLSCDAERLRTDKVRIHAGALDSPDGENERALGIEILEIHQETFFDQAKLETWSLDSRGSRRWSLESLVSAYAELDQPTLIAQLRAGLEGAVQEMGSAKPAARDDRCVELAAAAALQQLRSAVDSGALIAPIKNESDSDYSDSDPEWESIFFRSLLSSLRGRVVAPPTLLVEAQSWLAAWTRPVANKLDARGRIATAAAALIIRDGDTQSRNSATALGRTLFRTAIQTTDLDDIALLGVIALLCAGSELADLHLLLEAAAAWDGALVDVFKEMALDMQAIDERLPRAIVRIGLSAQVHQAALSDESTASTTRSQISYWTRMARHIELEFNWLQAGFNEPDFPTFPAPDPAPKRTRGANMIADKTVAKWLQVAASVAVGSNRRWLRRLVAFYASWTVTSDSGEGEANPYRDWQDAYFDLLVKVIGKISASRLDRFVLRWIEPLPDGLYLNAMTRVIGATDEELGVEGMCRMREIFGPHLLRTWHWRWLIETDDRYTMRSLGPLLSAVESMFLARAGAERLSDECVIRLMPILETLTRQAGRDKHVAQLFTRMISFEPCHLGAVLRCANAWVVHYATNLDFWSDGPGNIACVYLGRVMERNSASFLQELGNSSEVDALLDTLIRIGVGHARDVEEVLFTLRTRGVPDPTTD